jgi:hypothetical protein
MMIYLGHNPLSLCVNHKEGLCASSGDINRLNDDDDDILIKKLALKPYFYVVKRNYKGT